MNKQFLFKVKAHVPPWRFREMVIPQLEGCDLSEVSCETPDEMIHKIEPGQVESRYKITFNNQKPDATVELSFYQRGAEQPEIRVKEISRVSQNSPVSASPAKPKKSFPFFKILQDRRENQIQLNHDKIKAIRETDLSFFNLEGKKVLTFDFTGCWARALGMIQKAIQLQHQFKKPLHEIYDRITGQGDGAIIAAAIAAGIDLDRLAAWWVSDWKKVHSPGLLKGALRWSVKIVKRNESGYNAKQARAALQKLFVKTSADLRMKDVLTELQITVIQADMKVSTHHSDLNPDMELWTAVEDSAITKIHFNQKQTVKGEAAFLGAIEKNDVLGLLASPDNKNLQITSIGVPVRINPPAALKYTKTGHAGDKIALQAAGHFLYEKRVKQIIEKLIEAGCKFSYLRLDCDPLDGLVSNDTSATAQNAGIESGSGKINLQKLLEVA